MGNSDLTQIIKNILTEIELLKTQNKISNLTMPDNGVIVVPSFATDPTTYSNGQMWYNTTSGLFKYVEGGTIKVFGGGSVSWGGITGTLASQTDLQSALDAKAASSHNHVEADITDLDKYTESEVDTLLSGKSDTGHTHTESDITDLGSYLEDITSESIDDLSDVNLGTPSDEDVLQYDSATSKWVAQALTSLGGKILQVDYVSTSTQNDIAGYNGSNHPENHLEIAVTPTKSTSHIYVLAVGGGLDNGGSGRMGFNVRHSTSSGQTNGTDVGASYTANDSTGTNGMSTGVVNTRIAFGDTNTHYVSIVAVKADTSATGYISRYGCQSSILIVEVDV